jgi:AraC-like DNA-binding protein
MRAPRLLEKLAEKRCLLCRNPGLTAGLPQSKKWCFLLPAKLPTVISSSQDFEIPEQAIASFERLHSLRVTVHDLRGSLWPFLNHDRFHHTHTLCQAVKHLGRESACVQFSVVRLRQEISDYPQGRLQICHAGFLQWVVPVFRGEALEWVIFAGVRTAGPDIRDAVLDMERALPDNFWPAQNSRPATVNAGEAALILEHLRQLTARLRLWNMEMEAGGLPIPDGPRAAPSSSLALRRTLIQRYIARHHTERIRLGDLASTLSLSEWRTSHAVRECCGHTFQELLSEARLRTAMGLLRHSELSVMDVALRSGFDDVRQFHRLFKRQLQTTPLQYRKAARA